MPGSCLQSFPRNDLGWTGRGTVPRTTKSSFLKCLSEFIRWVIWLIKHFCIHPKRYIAISMWESLYIPKIKHIPSRTKGCFLSTKTLKPQTKNQIHQNNSKKSKQTGKKSKPPQDPQKPPKKRNRSNPPVPSPPTDRSLRVSQPLHLIAQILHQRRQDLLLGLGEVRGVYFLARWGVSGMFTPNERTSRWISLRISLNDIFLKCIIYSDASIFGIYLYLYHISFT